MVLLEALLNSLSDLGLLLDLLSKKVTGGDAFPAEVLRQK